MFEPGKVLHTFNSSIYEAEAKDFWVRGLSRIQSEFQNSRGCLSLCTEKPGLKNEQQQQKGCLSSHDVRENYSLKCVSDLTFGFEIWRLPYYPDISWSEWYKPRQESPACLLTLLPVRVRVCKYVKTQKKTSLPYALLCQWWLAWNPCFFIGLTGGLSWSAWKLALPHRAHTMPWSRLKALPPNPASWGTVSCTHGWISRASFEHLGANWRVKRWIIR